MTNTALSKRSSVSDSQHSNRIYTQFSSVLFKTCSWLNKSSQETATGCSQYTAGYIRCFSAIKSTAFQFHSPMQVSFRNYSTTEFSPRRNERLYFLAFFIHLQVRKPTNGGWISNYIVIYIYIYIYISPKYMYMYIYLHTGKIKDLNLANGLLMDSWSPILF